MEDGKIIEELTIVPLLTKYTRGEQLTLLEEKTIEIWLSQSKANRVFFEDLKDPEKVASTFIDFDLAASTTECGLEQLHAMLDKHQSRQNWKYWISAAAIIFTVSLSIFLYRYFQSPQSVQDRAVVMTADIDPGKEQATLSFEDGKSVELKGTPIKTDRNGTFYSDGTSIAENTVQSATLSTPRKGQYKMTLPDGTKVWLNAESSLKFPTQFTGSRREVELNGEGYFEVAHNAKKPFIVSARGQKVKVLGTKFNINSYENETAILTTLVSGSVELTNSQNSTPVLLKPGQQGTLFSLSSLFFVDDVDTEVFTAWTSNDFRFSGTPLKEVFKQLERWYDIEVDYSKVPNSKVHGTISREKKLKSVLYALEQTTDLRFKVTGRRIDIETK